MIWHYMFKFTAVFDTAGMCIAFNDLWYLLFHIIRPLARLCNVTECLFEKLTSVPFIYMDATAPLTAATYGCPLKNNTPACQRSIRC